MKEEKAEKSQCISRTQKGKRCSRSACVGDRCKIHAKNCTNEKVRASVSGIIYHNHPPGIISSSCEACLLKNKSIQAEQC